MRWRPAKAFLLDERNALVHELTLDPTCAVSLPEAIAAGALNANGVGVRVSRYHGQAVRAGGMALLVLSNGPPEPETVELARQLLLGTLARLGDSARDRLDLARTEEARLDSERRRVAAWTADVQARERGVAGLHEATVVSQGRIATNAAAAASRAQALSSGEASLAARETAVAARENEIVARAADADARIAREKANFEAAARRERSEFEASRDADQAAVAAARTEVDAKAQAADAREAALSNREAHSALVDRALSEREARLSAEETNVIEREREVEGREAESESFFQELSLKVAQNAKWEKALRATAADLERRAKELGVDLDVVPKREPEKARAKKAGAKG